MRNRPLLGGLEAGGTKVVCAIGTGPDDIRATMTLPTTSPVETLRKAVAFFRDHPEPIAALGVGTFGLADLDPASATYGQVTTTPKPGWAHTDLVGPFRAALGIPIGFDTDVNVAGLG
ncbi:MAG: ROK family protein, partial [Bacteroidota bacterium]